MYICYKYCKAELANLSSRTLEVKNNTSMSTVYSCACEWFAISEKGLPQ